MNLRIKSMKFVFISVALAISGTAYAAGLSLQDACDRKTAGTAQKSDPNAATLSADPSGTVAITDYSGSYAVVGDCEVTPSKAPVCAISASNTKVAKGSTVTLFAKCTAPTDSLTWNIPVGTPSLSASTVTAFAKTVTLTDAGAYAYTVKGTSTANGAGATSAPVTVLVGNDVVDKPSCILTLSPASIPITQSATASAVCHPEATSYVWDAAETNAPASPSSATPLANLTFNTVGSYTYKIAGVNSAGTGPKASATITVGTAVTFRAASKRSGAGSLSFPTGTQGNDWLVMYVLSNGDMTDLPPSLVRD